MLRVIALAAFVAAFIACAEAPGFDSASYLRSSYVEQLGADLASQVEIPYALSSGILAEVGDELSSRGSDRRRASHIVDLIFGSLGLEYELRPTRNAEGTFDVRRGNCLSFVNLFIGLARHVGLNAFYVEVVDQKGWSYRHGTVVSRGHIVAGIHIDGVLETFDFLPYRPKSYRDFKPLDDRLAIAHYYNNLGAEALIAEDLVLAEQHLSLVGRIAPDFVNGLNNLGVCLARLGKLEAALATYQRGLDLEPDNVAVLTNAARIYQEKGHQREAEAMFARIQESRQASPYFYVYQGEKAIAEGDLEGAMDFLREALRRDSELPEVHLGLVKLHLALGDFERARHFLARARKLDASHPEISNYSVFLTESPR